MSQTKFKKDVFMALAAIAWADGQVEADEADAIVRAALDSGLELDEIDAIEAASKNKIELGSIDVKALGKEDRVFVYAVAYWIATLDGKVTEGEAGALSALAEKLGIPERPRAVVEKLAREVAALPEGDRPMRYDLQRLQEKIGERLQKATAAS